MVLAGASIFFGGQTLFLLSDDPGPEFFKFVDEFDKGGSFGLAPGLIDGVGAGPEVGRLSLFFRRFSGAVDVAGAGVHEQGRGGGGHFRLAMPGEAQRQGGDDVGIVAHKKIRFDGIEQNHVGVEGRGGPA